MGVMSFNRFRKNPAKVIEAVVDREKPITITRADGKDVVIISATEFESWKETMHLLRRPKNVRRLRDAVAEIEAEIARRNR